MSELDYTSQVAENTFC